MINFEAALKTLADAGVSFIIVEGYAAVAHGSAQITKDLDICYERSGENQKRMASALTLLHARLRDAEEGLPFVPDERTIAQGMNFTFTTDFGDIDVFGELPGVGRFADLVSDAIPMELFGMTVRVASLAALIRSKRAAGRPKDLNVLPELEALQEMSARRARGKKV